MAHAEIETREDITSEKGGSARYWRMELDAADKAEEEWRDKAGKIINTYKGERQSGRRGRQYNILSSNTQTLLPALYARTAQPDVRRRFMDADPVGRQVAIVVERALSYSVDQYDIDETVQRTVLDELLPGRGVARVFYEPEIAEAEYEVPTLGSDGSVTYATETEEYVADQRVYCEYVHWRDFRVSPAKTWEEARWIAFRHLLTREQLEEQFPEHGSKVPLGYDVRGADKPDNDDDGSEHEIFKRAEVWEIWDKAERERVWVARGYDELLEREEDPYGLENFWPIPEPLYGVRSNESLVPTPEYCLYEDQAKELNEITTRITRLIRALKRRGVYNASIAELKRLADGADNEFIPVEDFTNLMQNGGLANQFQPEDVSGIAAIVVQLYEQRQALVQEIYEITGVSDVLRGQSDPRESATATRAKSVFGGNRLKARQTQVQRFVRDLYRLKAELMVEHFEPEVLARMTQTPVDEQMVMLMRDDRLRSYSVDIETDSTVFEDAEAEKQARTEFVTALTGFAERWIPAVQQMPQIAPLAQKLMMFAMRPYKVGRGLEEAIEQVFPALQQAAQQPKPDPEMMKVQAKAQADMAKLQTDAQMQQQKLAMEAQSKEAERQAEAQAKAAEMQQDMLAEIAKLEQEGRLEVRDQNLEYALKQRELEMKRQIEAQRTAQQNRGGE